ncbi:MAG: DUF5667 domain-containing protein, partial [Actinomycetes bacterium]
MTSALPGRGRREADEFAALLDGGRMAPDNDLAALVLLARGLVPTEHSPTADFKAGLRERLVAEASGRTPLVPAARGDAPARPRPRLRHAVATIALASVVTGAGAAVASTRALPGDTLYGLKRQIENVQLALAGSDLERGRELLQQADARLDEAEALASSSEVGEPETQRALATALGDMQLATDRGVRALTDSYRETGDTEPMLLLDRFVVDQRERLEDLLALLDPALRARILANVDALTRTAARAQAMLAPLATGSGPAVGGHAAGDGWAVGRLLTV